MKKLKFFISFLSILGLSFGVAHLLTSCKEKDPLVVQGNIEGTVTDSETSQAISGVSVTIVANSNTTFAEQSKNTGSDGKFSFKDIEAGSYKLTFSKSGYEDNSKNISLTAGQTSSGDATLTPIKPVLAVSTTALDFGTATTILPVEIRNTGKGELNWSIVEDLTWLSVNPTTGRTTTEPASVTVSIDRSLFTETSKTGTFTISSNGGSAVVNVTAGKVSSVLSVTPATLDFGTTEIEKTINVSNTGAGTLTFTATAGQSWITLEGANGSVTTDIKIIKVTVQRTGLSAGDYSGSVVINSNSNSITVPVTATIAQPSAPDLLNGQASGITYNAAQASGTLTSLGSSAITQHGHCWNTNGNPTTTDNKTTLGGTSVLKSFSSNLTGLSANTTYYVRAYATNSVGTTYSDAITFTTLVPPTLATVQTINAQNIKRNQIDGIGNLTVLGDGLVSDYGFCYSASNANPTTSDSKKSLGQTTQLGNFTATMTGLQQVTKYYMRAYAVNSIGTAYGTVIEATTTDPTPVVTSGLMAYYTFDDSNCAESQGNSEYNGVKQGSGNPAWSDDIPGSDGKALQLNNDVYFQIATAPINLFPTNYSFSVWLKTTKNDNTLVDFNSSSTRGVIYISSANKVASYYTYLMSRYYYYDLDVSELILNGQWHLLTITKSSNTLKLYIDGTYYSTYSTSESRTDNAPMRIGNGFSGKMDNLRVYNRALSQNEITEIFNAKQ